MVYVWLALQFFGQRPTEKDVDRMERFGDGIADVIETISVQFNQFFLAKNCKLATEPRRTQKAYKAWAGSPVTKK